MTHAELAAIRERAERAAEYTISALGSKCLDQDIPALLAEVERLREALRGAKRAHDECDDPYYSCLALRYKGAGEYESGGGPCTCGANEHNAAIDEVLK